MHLDYVTGRETRAIFEPDYEQIIALRALATLCIAISSNNRKINGNYFKRRKVTEQSRLLMRGVRNHLANASTNEMTLMGEFELEAMQRGTEELLAEDGHFERMAQPLVFGRDEHRNQLVEAKAENLRMYAQIIYLALATREVPNRWQPIFRELDD